jgi:surface antigen
MRGPASILAAACALAFAAPAFADSADFGAPFARELPPYLQCVPYARERSGVQIYGDAWTWWDQAAGRYKRGNTPRVGAVMAFRASGNMRLGHVAAVSRVIDSRTVLLDHANWSPIDGRRGQIERGVKAIDASPANDWSEVRVWYAPLQDIGTTAWPVEGFIYNEREDGHGTVLARADYAAPAARRVNPEPSREFLSAFAALGEPAPATALRRPEVRRATAAQPAPQPNEAAAAEARPQRVEPRKPAARRLPVPQPASGPSDPIRKALARYER